MMEEQATMFHVDKEFLTVTELNNLIKDVVNMGFPQNLWVCGEIQGYNRNRLKNHIFFELVDKEPERDIITSRVGLVIFAGKKIFIDEILRNSENAFELKDDIEVKFLCKVDFYPPHGAIRLIVESIDPVYTLGKIAQEKQRLLSLLKKKGVLDKNKQLVLSPVPLKVGLISSHDSAAYNDFLHELKVSGIGFKVYFKNALMQGKEAEKDVCKALSLLEKMGDLDTIVITRGGGSIADLSCFDSQMIAEKIASLSIPVLSGIGHEINITVTDLTAHTYQKTPTAIARFLVERVETFLNDIALKADRIIRYTQERLKEDKTYLRQAALSIRSTTESFMRLKDQEMLRLREIMAKEPFRQLTSHRKAMEEKKSLLAKTVKGRFREILQVMDNYERMIALAQPSSTLKRGFSITRLSEGTLVRSKKEVSQGEVITTELRDGMFKSKVE